MYNFSFIWLGSGKKIDPSKAAAGKKKKKATLVVKKSAGSGKKKESGKNEGSLPVFLIPSILVFGSSSFFSLIGYIFGQRAKTKNEQQTQIATLFVAWELQWLP